MLGPFALVSKRGISCIAGFGGVFLFFGLCRLLIGFSVLFVCQGDLTGRKLCGGGLSAGRSARDVGVNIRL